MLRHRDRLKIEAAYLCYQILANIYCLNKLIEEHTIIYINTVENRTSQFLYGISLREQITKEES